MARRSFSTHILDRARAEERLLREAKRAEMIRRLERALRGEIELFLSAIEIG